jgi:hypothetical protein
MATSPPPYNTLSQLSRSPFRSRRPAPPAAVPSSWISPPLAARSGPETPVLDLAPKLKCVFCGGPGTLRIGAAQR